MCENGKGNIHVDIGIEGLTPKASCEGVLTTHGKSPYSGFQRTLTREINHCIFYCDVSLHIF